MHSHALIRPVYTVLGRVVDGMDTLDRIVQVGTVGGVPDGPPAKPVRILHVISRAGS